MDLPWFALAHRNISNYLLQCNYYTMLSMSTSLYRRGGCWRSAACIGGEGSGERATLIPCRRAMVAIGVGAAARSKWNGGVAVIVVISRSLALAE